VSREVSIVFEEDESGKRAGWVWCLVGGRKGKWVQVLLFVGRGIERRWSGGWLLLPPCSALQMHGDRSRERALARKRWGRRGIGLVGLRNAPGEEREEWELRVLS